MSQETGEVLLKGIRWCQTRTGRAKFRVAGTIATGASIWPGKMQYPVKFPKPFMDALLKRFEIGEFPVGGAFDDPTKGSLGEFIQHELHLKLNPAVYLAALLIDEGYAETTRRGYLRLISSRTKSRSLAEDTPVRPKPQRAVSTNKIDKGAVVCLSCVKSKKGSTCRAEEMYVSALFSKMLAYAKSLHPKKIYILSAKYGLLNLDDVIEPYELTLKNLTVRERESWAAKVLKKMRKDVDLKTDQFIFLAGMPYRENLLPHIENYAVPMEGLSFGLQLQWLDEHVR